jgi:glucans biosynthesis protein C
MDGQSRIVEAPRGDDSLDALTTPARGLCDAKDEGAPTYALEVARADGAKTSLALSNMRGLVILILLAFHSVLAYLGFLGPTAFAFDDPPYGWRAFPIIDSQRWFGFDIFCAWVDVYLMSLMFFLSALFASSSLARKGGGKYLRDRFLRLGAPFVVGVAVVAPLALYPAYRVTAVDPSPIAYIRHFLALPFWPDGPMWFLWVLIAFTIATIGLRRLAPGRIALLAQLSSRAAESPGRYFLGLVTAAAVAYVPLALVFTPWEWGERGPFSLQLSRPLLYAVYYFAGLGVGMHGLERGLLAVDGMLARRWNVWLAFGLASLGLWMGLTALTFPDAASAPLVLRVGADASFALAGASGCFWILAICLRFGAFRSPVLDSLSNNAFGMYLLHYMFVVWLQYFLLDLPLLAIAKASIVFAGAAAFSWLATVSLRSFRFGSRMIGEAPQTWTGAKGRLKPKFAVRGAGPEEPDSLC